MVKFGKNFLHNGKDKIFHHGKKSKATKRTQQAVSPLMAEKEPKSSSSSRLEKDKKREKRRKERDERFRKRDEKIAHAHEAEEAKKKSKKTRLSQGDQDTEDANMGKCYTCGQFLVKTIHLIDLLIGLIFIVYGSLIMNFENPAMEAVITCLAFGCTMVFTVIMGVIGFTTKACSRFGLAVSAYMGPLIACFHVFVIIALIGSPIAFFTYLTDHRDVLYLNEAEILLLENLLPLFYIIMASLAGVEIVRFLVLRKIRHKLVRYDAATERITSSHNSERGSRRSDGSNRTNLSQPLLGGEEV